MKKIIYIVFLIITNLIFAQNTNSALFDAANDLYRKEKYTEAIDKYEAILYQNKVESAEVYFNLGNCYYKLGKIAPSIYNFEKALLLSPKDETIKTNLTFAQKMAIDDIKVTPRVGFSNFLYESISVWSVTVWAWLAVSLSVAFLLFFIGYYFSGTTLIKRIFFLGMFFLLGFMLCSILFAYLLNRQNKTIRPAIVFEELVNVKTEPKTSAENAFMLHEGTKVFVKETLDNWKRIELTDKSEGWIKKEAIRELKD
ncbi:BatE protein [Flavobacterium sp. 9AF]|uniref:tetratricopeptide repeat protein n=1 Tax=Flavobacterium sp. 9AF TaxID=2653142 RepID=UPI0012EFC472|nr:tetratricopeptide repeat protein [Flavobacterium sp. 9AF]VXB81515.1 BatE protein [Flavobacterium sp. 9AF]